MSVTVNIKGLDKLEKGLLSLPTKVARKVLGDAIRKGAYLLRDATQAKTPVKTGALRDSIKVKSKKLSEVEYQSTVAPFLSGGSNPVWYAHLVEFGGRYVIKAKGGDKDKRARVVATGRIGAQPFMRPAFDSTRSEIIRTISDKLADGVAREFKKLGTNG